MEAQEIHLAGCRPEPLSGYLVALGVLRTVALQADPQATGAWRGDAFVLRTTLTEERLTHFFLRLYAPTPITSPWNGGSGYHPKDKGASETLTQLMAADDPRLHLIQVTVTAARTVVARAAALGWTREAAKEHWVRLCRASFPEPALDWLDVATVLTADGLDFPAIVGATGGNFGRADVSANYLRQVLRVLRCDAKPASRERVEGWLRGAVFDEAAAEREAATSSAYEPAAAGGPAAGGGGLVNPWALVLAMEGVMLFAAAATRRLESAGGGAPFAVRSSPVGYASAARENAKGEIWAPLWAGDASLAELRHLFGEGRATWRGARAATGLDFALAIGALGVDRGIQQFSRHGLVERLGQNLLAVPLDRIEVAERHGVRLVEQLEPWLERVRGTRDAPSAVRSRMGLVERRLYALARVASGEMSATHAEALLSVLVSCADLETALARATGLRRGATVLPVQRRSDGRWRDLDARQWLPWLPLDRPEQRLAVALASVGVEERWSLREWLRPVQRQRRGGPLTFRDGASVITGLGLRPLEDVLADVLVTAGRIDGGPADLARVDGADDSPSPLRLRGTWAQLEDVVSFLDGTLDRAALESSLRAFLLLGGSFRMPEHQQRSTPGCVPPRSFVVLAPFFQGLQLPPVPDTEPGLNRLTARRAWPAALRAGRVAQVVDEAVLDLRIAGQDPVLGGTTRRRVASRNALPMVEDELGPRGGRLLAAALLARLSSRDGLALLHSACPPPLPTDRTTTRRFDEPAPSR